MKLAVTVACLILLFGAVNAYPQELTQNMDEGRKHLREIITALLQSSAGAGSDEKSTEFNGESEKLENMIENVPEAFLQSSDEVEESNMENQEPMAESESDTIGDQQQKAQKEELLYNQELHEVAASQENVDSAIMQGDTVALQTFVSSFWLGCAGAVCGRANCPRMIMSGSDWTNCWGEVFEIYREDGPGEIQVGDRVGLYYPRESGKWLGCAGNNCGKAGCPGQPNQQHGMAEANSWNNCWGEVFIVFARGKNDGDVINSNDNIALYYERGELWVAQGYDQNSVRLPCLGNTLPPPLASYDGCSFETFRIWKKTV